jgi:hypothetical protein
MKCRAPPASAPMTIAWPSIWPARMERCRDSSSRALPRIMLQGHVHVVQEGSPSRVAGFKDPDGNLHSLNNGSGAAAE